MRAAFFVFLQRYFKNGSQTANKTLLPSRDAVLSLPRHSEINAADLVAERANVKLDGMGSIFVNVSVTTRVTAGGGGFVEIYGDSEVIELQRRGAPRLYGLRPFFVAGA